MYEFCIPARADLAAEVASICAPNTTECPGVAPATRHVSLDIRAPIARDVIQAQGHGANAWLGRPPTNSSFASAGWTSGAANMPSALRRTKNNRICEVKWTSAGLLWPRCHEGA